MLSTVHLLYVLPQQRLHPCRNGFVLIGAMSKCPIQPMAPCVCGIICHCYCVCTAASNVAYTLEWDTLWGQHTWVFHAASTASTAGRPCRKIPSEPDHLLCTPLQQLLLKHLYNVAVQESLHVQVNTMLHPTLYNIAMTYTSTCDYISWQ
jgi:hypothetical protein